MANTQPYVQMWLETSGVGNETVTPDPSTKTIYIPFTELEASPGAGKLDRNDEAGRNTNYDPVPHQVDGFKPKLSFKSRLYPDLMGFLLAAAGGLDASVYSYTAGDDIVTDLQGTVIPTGCHRHRWVMPMTKSGAYPQSIAGYIGHPGEGVYYEFRGHSIAKMEWDTPDEGGAMISVELEGTYVKQVADPALTPAAEALSVLAMTKHTFSVPSFNGGAPIKSLGMGLELPVESEHYVSGGESQYPTTTQYTESGLSMITGEVEKPTNNAADWDSAVLGTAFAAMPSWSSPTIAAGTYRYRTTVALPQVQIDPDSAGTGQLGNKRRTERSYAWTASTDGTEPSATFEVVNVTASYA